MVDVSGKLIWEQYVNSNIGSLSIDTHSLTPGYYLVQVEGMAGLMVILPFVKL